MSGLAIRRWTPRFIRNQLWGNRERWGLVADVDDPSWQQWQVDQHAFYSATQRSGVGRMVNDAGYRVMSSVPLDYTRVLELGAADIRHMHWWRGRPTEYVLADVSSDFLEIARRRITESSIPCKMLLLEREDRLPLVSGSVDVAVSFYSLEHLHPLALHIDEMWRVLKPGGALVGAIPAEGGLGWGLGRWLTSRRWLKRNTRIDPDKIICWEHPNFADEIIDALDRRFLRESVEYWPLRVPLLDLNLVLKFVYRKAA